MAVTEYETPFKREKVGLCSGWLRTFHADPVPCWLKKGTMTLPKKGEPIIMVGPGTGVAAFRSFIQSYQGKKVLIFGCRGEK